MNLITLVPAYGRSYEWVWQVKEDLAAGKDFAVMNPVRAAYANKDDMLAMNYTHAKIYLSREGERSTVLKLI